MTVSHTDTIAAIATPPGRGGVAVLRVSGPDTQKIAKKVLGCVPSPRYATMVEFKDKNNAIIDQGIALYFPNPHSFTGEDVLELHGHGGPVVMDMLLQSVLHVGARLARPGEFSERAFLNDKVDLAQAEAIADLIDAGSEQAARSALRSLQGEFSQQIKKLVDELTRLRMMVESAIDFPEEEIDFLKDSTVKQDLAALIEQVAGIEKSAQQGALLQEGMTVVIAGKPNVGKSSLLNYLSGHSRAIVTDIAGTTRDVLQETIQVDGMPLHVVDTAGLRESDDIVEQEGIRRTKQAMANADMVWVMIDATEENSDDINDLLPYLSDPEQKLLPFTVIKNKIDLTKEQPQQQQQDYVMIQLSAKTGEGVDLLRTYLKNYMGFDQVSEGNFTARRRHLDAIARAKELLIKGENQLAQHQAGELLAEDLRQAQQALQTITGEFTADDLLGKIFSEFCIGK